MRKEQLDKEIKIAWMYCYDVVVPFWRRIFCSDKNNFAYFKNKITKNK